MSCQLGKLQKNDATDRLHGQNQQFKDDSSLAAQEDFTEVANGNGSREGDSDAPSCLEPTCGSPHIPLPQTEDELNEIWAATVIQTAFRAFLVLIHTVMWIQIQCMQVQTSENVVSSNISANLNRHYYTQNLNILCVFTTCFTLSVTYSFNSK